jgi:replication factor C subunit 3/5
MVLLIDKYKIDTLSKVICHKQIYKLLINGFKNAENLTEWEKIPSVEETKEKLINVKTTDEFLNYAKNHFRTGNVDPNVYAKRYIQMPNLLIYGPNGCGKKTLINLLLEDIYDIKVHETKKVSYQITGYGNSSNEVIIEQSNYHIIIEPTGSGLDKYLIHEIVKEYAQQTVLNVHDCKTPFRIVFINNIDNLSYYAQTSLRYTMEKYHKTCKFILCGYQLSKIIEPLRSRCLNIRLPSPSCQELKSILFDVSCRENIDIDEQNLSTIIKLANGNIKKALCLMELYSFGITKYSLAWKKNIKKVTKIILNFYENSDKTAFNSSTIDKIRLLLYTIFITNIPGNQMITELLKSILYFGKNINPLLMTIIVQLFGHYETKLNKGKRPVIHLETLIMAIFYHIMEFKLKYCQNNLLTK